MKVVCPPHPPAAYACMNAVALEYTSKAFHSGVMNYLLLGVSIISILIMSLGGVVLPLWLGGVGKWNGLVIDVLTYFTGGVFLGAGMLHMLPDAVEDAKQAGGIADAALMNPFITFCLVCKGATGHRK